MDTQTRRSWLVVPASASEQAAVAAKSGADVVVLDLVEFVVEAGKPAARAMMQAAVAAVHSAGVEVHAQVDPELLYADLHACVWPGLSGIVMSRTESPRQVSEAADLLSQFESERGLLPGTVQIVAALETARGNQDAYEIACASKRLRGLTLGRADLIMDLRPEPSSEIHLMPYLMQRLITIAGAAGVTPLGAWWRAPDRGMLATPERTYQAAQRGRAIGFKGAMCVRADQVEPLNRGYSPGDEDKKAAQALVATYQGGLNEGRAVVLEGDRLIDRGAAVRAQALLDMAAACEPGK